jgi:hypothetical protein
MELSKVIDSQVSSGLTQKIYRTNINEIHPNDDKQKSELYEINIFGHILQIAPGLTIKDSEYKNLSYCYIYVILKNKVKSKLGIVEEITDSPPLIFDISLIEDGRLRMFDVFEQNPEIIKELEYVQTATTNKERKERKRNGTGYEAMNENVFDYIIREEIQKQTESHTVKGYDALSKQSKDESKKALYPNEQKVIVETLATYKKPLIASNKNMTESVVNSLRKISKDLDHLCVSLLLLETSLRTFNIILLDENDTVVSLENYRKFTHINVGKTLSYLVIKWENDTPLLIEKYSSYDVLPQEYKEERILETEKAEQAENTEKQKNNKPMTVSVVGEPEIPLPPPSSVQVEKEEQSKPPVKPKSALSRSMGRISGIPNSLFEDNDEEEMPRKSSGLLKKLSTVPESISERIPERMSESKSKKPSKSKEPKEPKEAEERYDDNDNEIPQPISAKPKLKTPGQIKMKKIANNNE